MIGLSGITMADVTSSGGVATDSTTNLQWQDDYNDNSGNIKSATWTDAIAYCDNLELGGKTDWRLPNKNELISIVDYTKTSEVFLDGFTKVSSGHFWSSTTYADNDDTAWNVNFGYGYANTNNKTTDYSVRCVRAGL